MRALALTLGLFAGGTESARAGADEAVPVLVYHRFGPTVADAMTVRTTTFEAQLGHAREQITARLGRPVDLLAWPFGIHDAELEAAAALTGYLAAFTIERRPVRRDDSIFALPRYLVTDTDRGAAFGALLTGAGESRHARDLHPSSPSARK